jgi:hypothetical protein
MHVQATCWSENAGGLMRSDSGVGWALEMSGVPMPVQSIPFFDQSPDETSFQRRSSKLA